MPSATQFDPSDTGLFVPVAAKTINLARVLGWDVRWMGVRHDAVTLRSPDGDKTINVPTTNVNANRAKSWIRAIFRYTDMNHLARFINGELDLTKEQPDVQSLVAVFGTEIFKDLTKKEEPQVDHSVAFKNPTAPAKPAPLPVNGDIPAVDPVMKAPDTKAISEPHVVSVQPFMRKDRNHRKDETGNVIMSPSEFVNVITYSDGSVLHGCTWEGCDYTAEKMPSVLIHRHHHTGATRVPHKTKRKDAGVQRETYVEAKQAASSGDFDVAIDSMLKMLREIFMAERKRLESIASKEQVEQLTRERDEARAEAKNLRENLRAMKDLFKDI